MQQLTGRASMGCCSTRVQFSRVGQGTSAVLFDNQLTLQGEWRGWRSSSARKFGIIACSSIPRFSSLLGNFVGIRCMISLGVLHRFDAHRKLNTRFTRVACPIDARRSTGRINKTCN